MRGRIGCGVVPAVLVWALCTAAAAQEPGVLVSPPMLTGKVPQPVARTLEQAVRDGLADAGTELAEAPGGCTDSTCLEKAVADGNAQGLVSTAVRVTGSDYVIVVDISDGKGGSLARQQGTCEICTHDEAATALRELVAATARALPKPEPAPVVVPAPVIDPEPAPAPASPPKRMSPQTTQILAITAIGVGVAALAGGITMLVLDQNPIRSGSSCTGVNVDVDGDCAFRYDTLGGGIGLTVAGAVVAGGGVGLLVWSRKRAKQQPPAELALVPWGLRARF